MVQKVGLGDGARTSAMGIVKYIGPTHLGEGDYIGMEVRCAAVLPLPAPAPCCTTRLFCSVTLNTVASSE